MLDLIGAAGAGAAAPGAGAGAGDATTRAEDRVSA
jgi:hypothetical protein